MTALERYAKLEAIARYLDGAGSEAREVVLSFGERSLIIVGLDDRPIAHWPLASLRALGPPAEHPLELVPDTASHERVLLEDREMGAAIAEVCPNLHRPPAAPPRRGLRALLWLGAAAAAGLAGFALLPPLPERMVDLVPPEREAALGEAVAARLPALLGDGPAPGRCVAEEGQAALRALAARLGPGAGLPAPLRLSVLDHAAVDALALPGGRVVILRGLLEAARTPEALAGVVAHAAGHALRRDPLEAALDRPGLGAAGILFGNAAGASAAARAADAVLEPSPLPEAEAGADEAAFATLGAAGLPTRPFAAFMERLAGEHGAPRYLAAHPWSAARAARVRAADTVDEAPFRPALGDRDWIALGSICDRTAPARR
jgi:beta-barrel assembly-enhancing protease